VAGQLGREKTPAEYVANLVTIFREVHRVIDATGTLWINLGDSYNNIGKRGGRTSSDKHAKHLHGGRQTGGKIPGLKPKDMIGIPWMVAFALRADGWYLRSDIVWHKPNVMPESVQDRPTKAHEYVFLLSKSENYFYDIDSVREPHTMKPQRRLSPIEKRPKYGHSQPHTEAGYRTRGAVGVDGNPKGRNRRTVWSINTKPFKGAHFATFPTELPSICIAAGSASGDLILDPFAGSGTTCAVAKAMGRRFLGIELNAKYAPLFNKRIAEVTSVSTG
jgi:DNA modification methylase